MHLCLHRSRHEAVIDEEVLLDTEFGVAPFQVAGVIVPDTMAQRQVLGAGGSTDRIRLDEAEALNRALQGGWRKQAAADGKPTQVVENNGHQSRVWLRGDNECSILLRIMAHTLWNGEDRRALDVRL